MPAQSSANSPVEVGKPAASLHLAAKRPGRVHLIGIAGSGLRSLGQVLREWGWHVTGSDQTADPALIAAGLQTHTRHAAKHVGDQTDLVIHSDAIGPDNPELRRAGQRNLPTLTYFEALGQLTAGRSTLAVAGTHGKSTTTAMAGHLLLSAGLDPTIIHGATPIGRFSGGRAGRGELMLVEACEYRANFLHLRPRHAVILGIEPDHFDFYREPGQLASAFAQFAHSVPADGLLLVRSNCPVTAGVAARADCRTETFGFERTADWSARGLVGHRGVYSFQLCRGDRVLTEVQLQVPGKHNVLNGLAAAALAWENGVSAQRIAAGLGQFRGLERRLEHVGMWCGGILLDDYAHHPTEVAVTLETVRRMYPNRRLWAVFQPHQASRTLHLLDELAASLQNADMIVVSDIFRAREPAPRRGEVTAADLARRVGDLGGNVLDCHGFGPIARRLATDFGPGDVLITMGAGNIRRLYDEHIFRLREDRAAG